MSRDAYGQPIGAAVAGWVPRQPPPVSPIEGRACRIEPLDPARHADDLFAAFMAAPDGRDWTYMAGERIEEAEAFRAFVASQAASPDPRHHAIVERPGGRAVGTAALMRIDPANGVIEVGAIAFSPSLQRTRAATEALYLLMRRVFDELGYRRLEWKCDALNAPSRRAAERLGFVFEGIFRQALVTKGRNRDTAWYAMTDGDWPGMRESLEAWLDDGNFDQAGRQIRPLARRRGLRGAGA